VVSVVPLQARCRQIDCQFGPRQRIGFRSNEILIPRGAPPSDGRPILANPRKQ